MSAATLGLRFVKSNKPVTVKPGSETASTWTATALCVQSFEAASFMRKSHLNLKGASIVRRLEHSGVQRKDWLIKDGAVGERGGRWMKKRKGKQRTVNVLPVSEKLDTYALILMCLMEKMCTLMGRTCGNSRVFNGIESFPLFLWPTLCILWRRARVFGGGPIWTGHHFLTFRKELLQTNTLQLSHSHVKQPSYRHVQNCLGPYEIRFMY